MYAAGDPSSPQPPWPLVQSWNWPAVSNLLALLRQNRNPGKERQGPRKQSKEGMEKDPSPGSLAPSLRVRDL